MELENGKNYLVNSIRKGTFAGRLLYHNDTWATFEITNGMADAIIDYNRRYSGDKVTVRREWCVFTKQRSNLTLATCEAESSGARMITGGFGMTMDLERGTMRHWVMGRDGVKRWADNNKPVAGDEPCDCDQDDPDGALGRG